VHSTYQYRPALFRIRKWARGKVGVRFTLFRCVEYVLRLKTDLVQKPWSELLPDAVHGSVTNAQWAFGVEIATKEDK
jgi:hypothetical protein